MKVAVIGSGISGLAAAYRLHPHTQVTLFEANDYFGGHTHTVDVTLPSVTGAPITAGVDTGFLVCNPRTYPELIALFQELEVETAPSEMSFSVQVPQARGAASLEWSGNHIGTLFAQKRNLISPRFWRMISDILRFNGLCTGLVKYLDAPLRLPNQQELLSQSMQDFLDQHGFSAAFRNWYFLPMIGCIWSCPTDQMLKFPVATMIRFCHNHGLLQITHRPQWQTVRGGAKHYVEKILAVLPDKRLNTTVHQISRSPDDVTLHTSQGSETFDQVIVATHSDQALQMLSQPSAAEQAILGLISYQPNRAVLHTDTSVMPTHRKVWAAWNYERATDAQHESARVCLHYWLNRLQPLPFQTDVIESLNPVREIAAHKILAEFEYSHPVFDRAAIQAQRRLPEIQGQQRTWFCGAWAGYGFHEDGLKAGYAAAAGILKELNLAKAE